MSANCYNADKRHGLKLHPDSRCRAASHIDVLITRPRLGNLVLHYFVTGKTADLRLPPATAPTRGDGLWQHTCFEVFVRAWPSAAYYEFNFAPSLQWAAYRFSGYRSGMRVVREISAPHMAAQSEAQGYQLRASLELDHLPSLPRNGQWRVGVSACRRVGDDRRNQRP